MSYFLPLCSDDLHPRQKKAEPQLAIDTSGRGLGYFLHLYDWVSPVCPVPEQGSLVHVLVIGTYLEPKLALREPNVYRKSRLVVWLGQ